MLPAVKDSRAADWEELARREPYFALLTGEGAVESESGGLTREEFLASGETDVASLLESMTALLGRDLRFDSTLDFGCGVGRLTLPLARRSAAIIGCDVAPTMLLHARANLVEAGRSDARLLLLDELSELPDRSLTLIVSLLVFQYIPARRGIVLLRTLLRLLAPGGVAAIHLMLEPAGTRLRRYARSVRRRSREGHRWEEVSAPRSPLASFTKMQLFDEGTLLREIRDSGCRLAGQLALRHGDGGSVVIVERPSG